MIEVVAGVILDAEGRILACQRPPGKHLAGKWEFPGGKVEAGETPEAALIRELEEELEITVSIDRPLTPVIWDYGKGPIRLMPYLCHILSGTARAIEHSQLLWQRLDETARLDWAAADLPILEELKCR